jgi:hypothetical protein
MQSRSCEGWFLSLNFRFWNHPRGIRFAVPLTSVSQWLRPVGLALATARDSGGQFSCIQIVRKQRGLVIACHRGLH